MVHDYTALTITNIFMGKIKYEIGKHLLEVTVTHLKMISKNHKTE